MFGAEHPDASDRFCGKGVQRATLDMPGKACKVGKEGSALLGLSNVLRTLLFFLNPLLLVGALRLSEGLLGAMETGMHTLQSANGCREEG